MFLDKNYFLRSESAVRIFNGIKDLPVLDAHNHADVKAIAANEPFRDLWELFAATDHYVWEVMRKREVPEKLITGDASNYDKFMALARIFPELAGNPVYEWIHLDLRFLGIEDILDSTTGDDIWKRGNAILKDLPPREILKKLNIEVMCSTDDPIDTLEEHDRINTAMGRRIIRPTWRPDKAVKISSPGWKNYIGQLGKRYNRNIYFLQDLIDVLKQSHDFFAMHGCRASDHGLEVMAGDKCDPVIAEDAFQNGCRASDEEKEHFAGVLMNHFGKWNAEKGWVTQLHLGAVRDVRAALWDKLGPDCGGDISSLMQDHLPGLLAWLNKLDDQVKTVLYCLDPCQQATLATVARAFGSKVRLGSAWWLCDTPVGMKRQLEYIGSVDLLMNFAGMVSDSRKLLSYGSRFAMFRRVLANVLGEMVEAGQMPLTVACRLAEAMAYHEPKKFFNF